MRGRYCNILARTEASVPRTNPNPLPLAPLRRGKGYDSGRRRSSFPFAKGRLSFPRERARGEVRLGGRGWSCAHPPEYSQQSFLLPSPDRLPTGGKGSVSHCPLPIAFRPLRASYETKRIGGAVGIGVGSADSASKSPGFPGPGTSEMNHAVAGSIVVFS